MPETEAAEADAAAEVAAEVEVKAVPEAAAAVAAEVEAARQFLLPQSNSVVVVVVALTFLF